MSNDRVAGWDLLRGLCALMVASYHLLYWLGLAELTTLGTYGVYLFFVLSGASLAYRYDVAALLRPAPVARFLATRWLRLAPLYVLLCVVFVLMLRARDGAFFHDVAERLLLNATFAFGFHDPARRALLIGGWSLGIEAVLYLAFPMLAFVAAKPRLRWAVFVLLALVQAGWIWQTVAELGWAQGNVAYHHVPAFAAYFFGGCMAGAQRKQQRADLPFRSALGAWALLLALLLALLPMQSGEELLGLRGVVLASACMVTVWISGRAVVPGSLRGAAAVAGDITYGTYLLHPMLVWGMFWFVVPLDALTMPQRWAAGGAILLLSTTLAWASERWFERPVRRWGRAVLRPRTAAAQSEVASISS